jgi:hypothetical protein
MLGYKILGGIRGIRVYPEGHGKGIRYVEVGKLCPDIRSVKL